jgi:hypothetical protein
MKITFLAAILAAISLVDAFVSVVPSRQSVASLKAFAAPVDDPELTAAIAEVRAAASAFNDGTEHFANFWIDRVLAGEQEGVASGLLEECLLDDGVEKCQTFEQALQKLNSLLGVGAGEQY